MNSNPVPFMNLKPVPFMNLISIPYMPIKINEKQRITLKNNEIKIKGIRYIKSK
jgi:hypothetical protein